MKIKTHSRVAIGLDIGTTSVSAVVVDLDAGELAEAVSVPNTTALQSVAGVEREQDAIRILHITRELLDGLLEKYKSPTVIGLTGQMHGIVYTDSDGMPCSNLKTWQDGRAGVGSPSPCDRIRDLTGYEVMPGYGLATYYADILTGQVPAELYKLCTAADALGMHLTGRKTPLVHTSNAASLGLFDLENMCFDQSAAEKLAFSPAVLPDVTDRAEILGEYRGIPVSVAIGDNQAAFLGSVHETDTVALANFGTGSQISLSAARGTEVKTSRSVEIRPFLQNRILISGSALCGGRAYATLERFFRMYAQAIGADGEQYAVMNELALQSDNILPVRTTFCGTREEPDLHGMISDITEDNLTPGALIAGVLNGMAEELKEMFLLMPYKDVKTLVLSGNAVRKNPALRKIVQQKFGMEVLIPVCREEASLGAALFAAKAVGWDDRTFDRIIRYEKI